MNVYMYVHRHRLGQHQGAGSRPRPEGAGSRPRPEKCTDASLAEATRHSNVANKIPYLAAGRTDLPATFPCRNLLQKLCRQGQGGPK